MIGDTAKAALNLPDSMPTFRALIRLDNKPLEPGDTPQTNPLVRFTNFSYYVRFLPSSKEQAKGKPFLLVSDLLPKNKIRFRTIMQLYKIELPEVKWLLQNCNISSKLLGIAANNIRMPVYLAFDIVKYNDKLRKQLSKEERKQRFSLFRPKEIAIAERQEFEAYLMRTESADASETIKENTKSVKQYTSKV